MNNTMGRYIDSLTDEERDRLITAPEFNDGQSWWREDCGCLVGTVQQGIPASKEHRQLNDAVRKWSPTGFMCDVPWRVAPASIRYPQAVNRFGKERVMRAIKQRAASRNCIERPEPRVAVG